MDAAVTAAGAHQKELNPIVLAMAKADIALSLYQRSMVQSLRTDHKHVLSTGLKDMGQTNLIYYKISLEKLKPIIHGLRCVPHEHI